MSLPPGLAADDAVGVVELRDAVIEHGIGFGELVALAFARDDVQELRPAQLLDVVQRRHQRVEIVPVDRADVVEAELLEHRAGRDHAFHVLFGAPRELAEHALAQAPRRGVEACPT